MFEEVYSMAVMKKPQVYRWHNCGHVSVNDQQRGQWQARDAQDLIHYTFIPERHTVNKEMYVNILHHLSNAVRRKHREK
jgi:hypothetical protein